MSGGNGGEDDDGRLLGNGAQGYLTRSGGDAKEGSNTYGGGGGGVAGGNGGNGGYGAFGSVYGVGGSPSNPDGETKGKSNYGSGGGVGGSNAQNGGSISKDLTGGTGGNGGGDSTYSYGGGGGGGSGGNGYIDSSGTIDNGYNIKGGKGGNGGGSLKSGGGSGGDGGAGFVSVKGVSTLVNTGTIVGGNGGSAGKTSSKYPEVSSGSVGLGGVGVFEEENLTVINSGTITGGISGNGTTQADALEFELNVGKLVLSSGGTQGTINGNIGACRSLSIDPGTAAGVAVTLASVIHDYSDFFNQDGIVKIGAGTLILTGANTYSGSTLILSGTLQLGDGTTTGSIVGNVRESGTLAFDEAVAKPLTFSGAISNYNGAGKVIQAGGSTVLTAENTYTGGTALNAGTLELGQQSSAGTGTIAFGPGNETLRLDFAGTTRSKPDTLAAPVTGFALGDTIDFSKVFEAGAEAIYDGTTLTVTNGTSIDRLTINAPPPGYRYDVQSDLKAGRGTEVFLTATNPTSTGQQTAADAVSLSSVVSYQKGIANIAGTAASAAGVSAVEISANVDGVATDLGAATVNADGTFTFSDAIGAHTQDFITATETNNAGGMAAAQANYSLKGGVGPNGRGGRKTTYGDGGDVKASVSRFGSDGQSTTKVAAAGQTMELQPYELVFGQHQANTSFVYDPGIAEGAVDVVRGFGLAGLGHDVIDLPSADFANLAAVFRNTGDVGGSAFITDPKTGDAIRLAGVSTAELKAHPKDFSFHA